MNDFDYIDNRLEDGISAAIAGGIERWHGIMPPNDVAVRALADFQSTISTFQRLQGEMRFEEEPSHFEGALEEASAIKVNR
jgi:hypothetical protein